MCDLEVITTSIISDENIQQIEVPIIEEPKYTFDFEAGIKQIYPKLTNWSKKFYSDYDNQLDLVSDTLTKVWKFKDKFDGENFGGWCYRLMHNQFINDYRFSKVKSYQDVEAFENSFVSDDLSQTLNQKALLQEINNYFDKSNDYLKDCFNLLIDSVSGFQYEELSIKYNLPIGTIKSKIFTARKKIIDNFKLN